MERPRICEVQKRDGVDERSAGVMACQANEERAGDVTLN